MRAPGLLIAIAVHSALAQSPVATDGLTPESLLLARIRYHMSESLRRQPNYTCLETVERSRRPKGGRGQVQDTLRLEVALVNGKELFAWPGSKKFEDRDFREIVTTGTFGNGNFAIFAHAIFMSNSPTFTYRGETALKGSPAVQYDFRVWRSQSGMNVKVNAREGVIGYYGSFWADPQTLDVKRIEITGDEIPKELELEATSDWVDYARVPIGNEPFLLPVESGLEMAMKESVSRNVVRFSNCHEYSTNSVLSFNEVLPNDSSPAPAPQAGPEEVDLPGGAEVTLALTEDLDLETVVAGDAITAQLKSDIKRNGKPLAKKGAIARGRITRVEKHEDHIALGLRFTDLDWGNSHAAMKLYLHGTLGVPAPNLKPRQELPVPRTGEGIVLIRIGQRTLTRGMLFYWSTNL
jgi:hypothetical protein